MMHDTKRSKLLVLANLWVLVAACDTAAELAPAASVDAQGAANVVVENEATLEAETKAAGSAKAEVVIEPASFDLEAVAGIVQAGELESAAELEVIVNDEGRGYNHIDVDADGTIDHVQVVEVEADAEAEAEVEADVALELRVVPSSARSVDAAVAFATVTFARHPVDSEVEIRARYTAVVRQPEVKVYAHVVPVEIDAGVVVGGSVFLSWVYAVERPVYVGVYEVDERGHWIPPGHVKHGHWKATGHTSAHGSKKSDARVVIDVRGGTKSSTKLDLGGKGKGSAKAHGGHVSGGSSKGSSSKGSKGKGSKGKGSKGK
jgi:hypothetical protein